MSDRFRQSRLRVIAFLLAVLLLPALRAQETTGAVRGEVTDATSARIADATVELVNAGTGANYRQQTNQEGLFTFNLIPPGTYTIRASSEGFQTYTVSGVRVELNRTTQVTLKLEIGNVSESVEVNASPVAIETASANVNTNVEQRLVVELPSSSRNPLAMAALAPGVNLIRPGSQVTNIEGTGANVNGLRRSANVYYMDGSDNTGTFRNTSLQFPNPEAVAEVQVSTASTSAEFGKQPGGVFNVVTKSGTNSLHGAGFYFFRDESLNANTWDRNRSGVDRPIDDQKQLGGVLGGPVIKNRTFFFGSFMLFRQKDPGFQNNRQVPTTALLNGDFSAFSRPLYNPNNGLPLANNQIPQQLLDPVAKGLSALFPTVGAFGQRFLYDFTNDINNNEALGKVDHAFNASHQLSASYMRTWGDSATFTDGGNNLPGWAPMVNDSSQHTVSAKHLWTVNPTTIAQFRFALAKHVADRDNPNQGKTLEDFGAIWPLGSSSSGRYLPNIIVSDGFTASMGNLSLFDQNNYRIGGTLSMIRGSHNIKVGMESQRSGIRQFNPSDRASFSFDGRASSKPAVGNPTGIGVFGYSIADFLMGRSSSFQQSGTRDYDIRNWSHYFFIQDEWRITPRLTLSPGLRYEFYQPSYEVNARASAFVFGHRSNQYPNAPLHMAFQGDAGIPKGFIQQDRNNFAPRLGLAWDITGDGKTALRAGGGIYYAFNAMNVPMWNSERIPWDPQANGGQTSSLVDPWGTSTTIPYDAPPTPFSLNPNEFKYPARVVNPLGYDPGWRTPYTAQWTLSIEREWVRGVSVTTGYVANRGLGFFQVFDGNVPVWAPNATLGNAEARRPIAGYGIVEILHARTRSWHDSFQLSTNIRRFKNLVGRFTYVYGKSLAVEAEDRGQGGDRPANPLNVDGEKGEFGNRHTMRAFAVYDLPFFRGTDSLAAKIFGNWQVSGSFSAQSGSRINAIIGEDWNLDLQPNDRPNVTGPITYTAGTDDERMRRFFDTSVFVNPSVRNTFGNLGRNSLFGPGSWDSDFAMLKNFPFAEGRFLQYRAEFYNVFNNNNLNNPNTTMRSVDFGRILNRFGNRTMQMGLRFVF
jgi:hypothetical protein